MLRHRSKCCLAAITAASLFLLSGAATADNRSMLNTQLGEAIVKVRTGETLMIQEEAARHLYDLTRGRNSKKVDDKTIADIVSLLDSPDDLVRLWVAASLGEIGPRARIAIPKLEQLLPAVDCLAVSKSSNDAIRYALTRMGAKLPPPCREYHYPSHQ